jgi:hypothetical protein
MEFFFMEEDLDASCEPEIITLEEENFVSASGWIFRHIHIELG